MQTQNEAIAQGAQRYHQGKPDGDLDLVLLVRTLLERSGLQLKLEAYDNDRFIVEAIDKSSDVQRFLLNRYWSQQLMYCSVTSIEERYCLIPNGTNQDWLSLFESKVLPFVVENDLPIKVA